jgi:hypothetical protein
MRALPHLLPRRQRLFLRHLGGGFPRTSFALWYSCESFVRTIRCSQDAVHNLYEYESTPELILACSIEIDDEYRRLESQETQITGSATMVVESEGIEEGRTRVRPRYPLLSQTRVSASRREELLLTEARTSQAIHHIYLTALGSHYLH